MLLRAVGVLMMLDGVMSAMAPLPMLTTFVYRSLHDQSLVVAHFLIGALLILSGRLLIAQERDRDSFPQNESRSRFRFLAVATLVAALIVACAETTRFDWPALVLRIGYTVFALAVLYRTTLPKT